MTTTTTSSPDAIACFAQADLALLAAALLARRDQRERALDGLRDDDLASLVRAAGGDEGLARALATMVAAARAADRDDLAQERTRLFDGPVTCPINETAYIRRDKGAIIADICGFHLAFGFASNEACGEKPDHLVTEFEFVGVLLVMLGEAMRAGDEARVEVVRAALTAFLRDHLGEWIGPFTTRLESTHAHPCFAGAGALLAGTWDLLARRFDLPPFAALDAEPDAAYFGEPGTPYECDMAPAPETVPLTGPAGTDLPHLN